MNLIKRAKFGSSFLTLMAGALCLSGLAPVQGQNSTDTPEGQAPVSYPVAVGAVCPPEPAKPSGQTSPLSKLMRQFEGRSHIPRQIILPNVHVFADLRLSSPVPGLTLGFQERVRVLHWAAGPAKSHFVRFKRDPIDKCGWVENDALLPEDKGANPMLVGDLGQLGVPGFEGITRGNKLDAKVLVRNQVEDENGQKIPGEGAKLYYRVGDDKPYGHLKIFNILNVFDVAQSSPGKFWFYVGGWSLARNESLESTLYGWTHAEDVIPWSSRMNLFFKDGATGVQVYGTPRDALGGTNPIGSQIPGDDPPPDRNVVRWPILESLRSDEVSILFKIAFPGSACLEGKKLCVTPTKFAERRSNLAERLDKGELIDILFVIDSTESMERYFPHVVTAVKNFLDGPQVDASRVRFSVTLYGDYRNESANSYNDIDFETVVPFGAPANGAEMQTLLRRKQPFADQMHDLPEAGFAALIRSIRASTWRPDAGWRLVVWIGDHPDRDDEILRNNKIANHHKIVYSTADVAQALNDIKGAFVGINVKGSYDTILNPIFIKQAEQIGNGVRSADGSGKYILPTVTAYVPHSGAESDAEIVAGVQDRLRDAFLATTKVKPQAFSLATTGKPLETKGDVPLVSLALAELYVRDRLGLSKDELKDFFSRSQLVTKGWVRQRKEHPDFDYWVAMRKEQMSRFHTAAKDFCKSLSDHTPQFDKLKDAMLRTLEIVTGDTPPVGEEEGKIREFLSKRLHVPVEQFSEVLARDIDSFVNWYTSSSPQETIDFKNRVCKRAKILDLAEENKRLKHGIDDLVFADKTQSWEPKPGSLYDYSWVWGTETGIRYYYLPLDYML